MGHEEAHFVDLAGRGVVMTAMLEIGDLHVSYGQVEAVRGVSLSLNAGQIISVETDSRPGWRARCR